MNITKILWVSALCLLQISAFGQWTRTSPNTYLTTTADNVGIGTQTPAVKLQVDANLPAQGTVAVQQWGVANSAYTLKLQSIWNTNGINYNFVQRYNNVDYQALSFFKGDVGLGTIQPRAKLDVISSMAAQGTYDVQYWSDGSANFALKLQQVWNSSGITQKIVQRFSGVDYPVLSFYAGKVGIGIDNPGNIDEKLAVKGTIHASEVRIDLMGSAAPDYVFEKSYNLSPLNEVESYIQENKHLPEIPAGKDIERDGLKVREMNLLLLRKIEELTLYLIEQDKTIKDQQRRLDALEANSEEKKSQ
jgi:hypothetical protein